MNTPNIQRLLETLVKKGPTYRADVARHLDISRTTTTNLVSSLLSKGLVIELPGGSLKNPIGLTEQVGVLAAVAYSMNTICIVLATPDGRVLRNLTLIESGGSKARLTTGIKGLHSLLHECRLTPTDLIAIHLAVDTQMDAQTGVIDESPATRSWYGTNPRVAYEQAFNALVYTENTQRMLGFAEYLWGAGKEIKDVFYVHVERGITCSHIINGALQSGFNGGAGELGHVVYSWAGPLCACGNTGCLMQYSSIPALVRDAREIISPDIDFAEFTQLAHTGDSTVVKLILHAGQVLGRCLVNTCHLIDPQAIILGGEVSHLPGFIAAVKSELDARPLPLIRRNIRILPSELNNSELGGLSGIEFLRRMECVISNVSQR